MEIQQVIHPSVLGGTAILTFGIETVSLSFHGGFAFVKEMHDNCVVIDALTTRLGRRWGGRHTIKRRRAQRT